MKLWKNFRTKQNNHCSWYISNLFKKLLLLAENIKIDRECTLTLQTY